MEDITWPDPQDDWLEEIERLKSSNLQRAATQARPTVSTVVVTAPCRIAPRPVACKEDELRTVARPLVQY